MFAWILDSMATRFTLGLLSFETLKLFHTLSCQFGFQGEDDFWILFGDNDN